VADYCSSPDTLTLAVGSTTVDLMSDQQGFRVSALDLGYPAVREVVVDNPDRNGATDLTKLLGARPVVITGALVPSPAGSRQRAWHALAPFLDPSARVTMTYRVDSDAVVKTMTLRAAQASALFDNPQTSPAQLGFKAADPVAYDANVQTATVYPFTAGGAGRAYNLSFNRVYPAGGVQSVNTWNRGDLIVWPMLRVYGPASTIVISWGATALPGQGGLSGTIHFLAGFSINAGDRLEIDCKNRTMYLNGDPTQNRYSQVDFGASVAAWPYIPCTGGGGPGPGGYTNWSLSVGGFSTATQLQITWQDAYLL
jgi:hypothetical protein